MAIRVATETIEDISSWANSEEPEQFGKALSLNESIPMPDDSDQEQTFSKADFERDLRKVSRKIKK